MEPESSLPYSQVPANCPYPEPTPSSPTTPSHFLKIHLNIILHLRLGLPNGSFSSGFPTKTLCTPLPSSVREIKVKKYFSKSEVERKALWF